ncbi:30S ribosome-binding factor RbfA [Bifidobacterium sp. UMB1230]|uniref:30S ribosome-binding factor RbfA n=1 Tax=Gardnerella pickettii TaxID=2914924 RepID=UPI0031FDA1C5|nr:30S ribosome-binding factor RbfA [Bifidobacterium sp. UMB1230]
MAGTNPRAARIAALIHRVIASNMESHLHDKRLANVTITEVRVTNDLQIAKVYWTQLGTAGKEQGERMRANQALQQAKGRLRTLVGAKAGLRLTPQIQFVYDEVPSEAHEIEDILVAARKRDEELAKARETAQYAGEADPYKKPREDEDFDDEDFDEDSDFEDDNFADSSDSADSGDFADSSDFDSDVTSDFREGNE